MSIYNVGYSVRSLTQDLDWSFERRQAFLINPVVVLPKSVDSDVWDQPIRAYTSTSIGNIPLAAWSNREAMLKETQYHISDKYRVELTAYIHILNEVPDYIKYEGYVPSDVDSHKYFIGYDIADDGFCSALSNCGYSKDDLAYCNKKYARHLNNHGLISEFEIAEDFLSYSNERVPEHAPFYIYSLYLDKKIELT